MDICVGSKSVLTLGEKIVFIEGNERTDKAILDRWFNNMKNNILFISANSVNNVNKLTEATLSLLHDSTKYTYFYCIRDRDFLSEEELEEQRATNEKIFIWSKYHIENFLINKEAIFHVSKKLLHDNPFENSEDILIKMKELVEEKKDEYINKMIDYELRKQFRIADYISIRDTDNHNQIENKILKLQHSFRGLSEKEIKLADLLREKELYLEKISY